MAPLKTFLKRPLFPITWDNLANLLFVEEETVFVHFWMASNCLLIILSSCVCMCVCVCVCVCVLVLNNERPFSQETQLQLG